MHSPPPQAAGVADPSWRRFPSQIPFIIGNEGCERFSFYGMRNILTTFLATNLLVSLPEADRAGAAKEVFHSFVIGVYFFPLIGGFIADRWFGKYRTIFWLSLVYTVGHACLAVFESVPLGFYAGLALIAAGSGGIKPCVSAFVGDQFDQSNKGLAKSVFDIFYWIINFGSFFATLLAPVLLKKYGPATAFGVPGLLMAVATLVFWLGRDRYVRVPPNPTGEPHGFFRVAVTAIRSSSGGMAVTALGAAGGLASLAAVPLLGFGPVPALCLALVSVLAFGGLATWFSLPGAEGHHPPEAITGVRSVLRLLVLFALVTPFWSLFDQKASTWLFQANLLAPPNFPAWVPTWVAERFHPAQMQSLNPLLVMLLIPFNSAVLYPLLHRLGLSLTPLRKMTAGLALASLSWVVVGGMQVALDGGEHLSILWQVLPYAILTAGEVLVSTTGLEFAYSQAPPQMKGTLMSFWNLAVTVGNLWVLLVDLGIRNPSVQERVVATGFGVAAFQMFFFALFALAAAVLFGWYASSYTTRDNYRAAPV